jgi:hypothetical protein
MSGDTGFDKQPEYEDGADAFSVGDYFNEKEKEKGDYFDEDGSHVFPDDIEEITEDEYDGIDDEEVDETETDAENPDIDDDYDDFTPWGV